MADGQTRAGSSAVMTEVEQAGEAAWERRLTRRGGEPLLDLPLFRDRAFSAGTAVNFALVFFFGSFMFVLTLLLQAGPEPPRRPDPQLPSACAVRRRI